MIYTAQPPLLDILSFISTLLSVQSSKFEGDCPDHIPALKLPLSTASTTY